MPSDTGDSPTLKAIENWASITVPYYFPHDPLSEQDFIEQYGEDYKLLEKASRLDLEGSNENLNAAWKNITEFAMQADLTAHDNEESKDGGSGKNREDRVKEHEREAQKQNGDSAVSENEDDYGEDEIQSSAGTAKKPQQSAGTSNRDEDIAPQNNNNAVTQAEHTYDGMTDTPATVNKDGNNAAATVESTPGYIRNSKKSGEKRKRNPNGIELKNKRLKLSDNEKDSIWQTCKLSQPTLNSKKTQTRPRTDDYGNNTLNGPETAPEESNATNQGCPEQIKPPANCDQQPPSTNPQESDDDTGDKSKNIRHLNGNEGGDEDELEPVSNEISQNQPTPNYMADSTKDQWIECNGTFMKILAVRTYGNGKRNQLIAIEKEKEGFKLCRLVRICDYKDECDGFLAASKKKDGKGYLKRCDVNASTSTPSDFVKEGIIISGSNDFELPKTLVLIRDKGYRSLSSLNKQFSHGDARIVGKELDAILQKLGLSEMVPFYFGDPSTRKPRRSATGDIGKIQARNIMSATDLGSAEPDACSSAGSRNLQQEQEVLMRKHLNTLRKTCEEMKKGPDKHFYDPAAVNRYVDARIEFNKTIKPGDTRP